MSQDQQLVTGLLQEWAGGNKEALDELIPLVHQQLHKLASRCLREERPDHTMRATALVNEAYMRLVDAKVTWQSRVHFFAIAARLLRRILVDYARAHNAHKRGGGLDRVDFEEGAIVAASASDELLELDDALQRLAAQDQRKSEVIELLFFGGLTYDETAAALNISAATVHRDLALAKAWLHRELAARAH